jgi:small subunit ribosomal protein S24e
MEIEIKSKRETPLLSRTRVSGFLKYEGATPSLLDVKQKVASVLKVNNDLVTIRHIYPRFGVEMSKVIAHVYQDNKELMKMEDKKTLIKNKFMKTDEELKKEAEEKAKDSA